MEQISRYLLGITAAAIICGVGKQLAGDKGSGSAMIKLICGLFLCMSVISPLVELRIRDLTEFIYDLEVDAGYYVSDGELQSQDAMKAIIKTHTEAYILDKAKSFNASVSVTVTLSDTTPYAPCAVEVTGEISPYAKARLSAVLEDDLGIGKEAQKWST